MGGRRAIAFTRMLAGIEAKPSPPKGFSDLPTALISIAHFYFQHFLCFCIDQLKVGFNPPLIKSPERPI